MQIFQQSPRTRFVWPWVVLTFACLSGTGCEAITTSAVLPSFRSGDKKIAEMAQHEKFPSPGDVGLGPVKKEKW